MRMKEWKTVRIWKVGVTQRNSKRERYFGCCARIYHYLSCKVREKVDAKISEA